MTDRCRILKTSMRSNQWTITKSYLTGHEVFAFERERYGVGILRCGEGEGRRNRSEWRGMLRSTG